MVWSIANHHLFRKEEKNSPVLGEKKSRNKKTVWMKRCRGCERQFKSSGGLLDHVRSVHAGAGFAGFAEASAPLSQRAKLVVLLGSLLAPAGIGGFAMRDALTLPALESFVLFGKWLCVAMMVGAAVYAMYVATFDETKQLSKMKLWHTVVFYFATTLFIAALSAAAYFIRLQWAIGWNLAFFASVAWYRVVYGHDYEHIVSHLFVIDKYGVVLLYFFFSCLKYEAKLFVVRRAFFWLCLRTLGVLLIFFFHTDKASGKKWSHRGAMGIFAGIILANAIAMDGPFKFSPFLELFVPPDVEGAMSNTIVVLSCSVLIFLVFFVLNDLVGPLAEHPNNGTERYSNQYSFMLTFASELTLFTFAL